VPALYKRSAAKESKKADIFAAVQDTNTLLPVTIIRSQPPESLNLLADSVLGGGELLTFPLDLEVSSGLPTANVKTGASKNPESSIKVRIFLKRDILITI
jgi:hypothetical protein